MDTTIEIREGNIVSWTSKSGPKKGRIREMIPPGQDVLNSVPNGVSGSRIKFDNHVSDYPRVLVEVRRRNKSHTTDLYCPRMDLVTVLK